MSYRVVVKKQKVQWNGTDFTVQEELGQREVEGGDEMNVSPDNVQEDILRLAKEMADKNEKNHVMLKQMPAGSYVLETFILSN